MDAAAEAAARLPAALLPARHDRHRLPDRDSRHRARPGVRRSVFDGPHLGEKFEAPSAGQIRTGLAESSAPESGPAGAAARRVARLRNAFAKPLRIALDDVEPGRRG